VSHHAVGAVEAPAELELLRVRVPLLRTHRSARAEQEFRDSILIRWRRRDGGDGWSECPTLSKPGYVTETTEAAWSALVHRLGPDLVAGRGVSAFGTPAAIAALADAECDARLRGTGKSSAQWMAERAAMNGRASLPWCAVLADVSLEPDQASQRAVDAVADGAAMVKLKLNDVDHGRKVVAAVTDAVAVPVAADANGTLQRPRVAELDDLGLVYLEQPLPAGTLWSELSGLRSEMTTPLALDESLVSVQAVSDALDAGAADVVSVKPARLGGGAAAVATVALCASRGVDCFVGGMFELGIGRALGLAVAALDGCTLCTDLGPSSRYVETDICDPLVTDAGGLVVVPTAAGVGRVPDPEAVERYLVARVMVSA